MTPPVVRSFVVQGIGAGVGQTLVVTAFVRSLRWLGVNAVAMKPVARGVVGPGGRWHSDELQRLAAVSAFELPLRALCTHLLAPDGGDFPARGPSAGVPSLESVVDTFNVLSTWADVVVIDCADVCAAALSLEFSTLDLARRLALPFVHVVGLQPGCVPEALHRVQTIVHGGLECAGWIANGLGPSTDSSEDLIRALGRAMPGSCLGTIPHLRPVAPERAAQTIDMRRSLGVLAA